MKKKTDLINLALYLTVFTIIYNLFEGLICIYFGYSDETLALFGFGLDSFVEVLSAFGILNMILLLKYKNKIDFSEKLALQITGFSFYVLTFGLLITSFINIYNSHKPITTKWGIVISLLSLTIMWILVKYKYYVGKRLMSDAIIADARCNIVCIQLSVVLLISSILYNYFEFGFFDSSGALIIAYFSFKEGRESFLKSKKQSNCC